MNALINYAVIIFMILLPQFRTSINIIGQWEQTELDKVTETSEAPPHIRLQFHRDGSFVATYWISLDGTYEVRGNDILTKSINSDSATTDRMSFKVEGDSLTLSLKGEEMKLKRLSPSAPGDLPTLGRWGIKGAFFHGGNNGLCELLLTKDGRITFKIQAEPERGRYKIKGNVLTMKGARYRIRFEEGGLILKSLDEPEYERKYKRLGKD